MPMQVMIFDFDVHHGNGTNDFFHGEEDVLFVSTHQDGTYPGTGKISDVGSGNGEGATINLPLPGSQTTPHAVRLLMCFLS
jgi:acetoin utilization deacetylase AcuC-like enzyme